MIDLGSLLPSQEIDLVVWLPEDITTGWKAETRVLHPNGYVVVEYPMKATGFIAWLNEFGVGLGTMLICASVLVPITFFIGYAVGETVTKKPESVKEEAAPQSETKKPEPVKEEAASVPALGTNNPTEEKKNESPNG